MNVAAMPAQSSPTPSQDTMPPTVSHPSEEASSAGVRQDRISAQDATAEYHRQRAQTERDTDEGVDFFSVQGAAARAKLEAAD